MARKARMREGRTGEGMAREAERRRGGEGGEAERRRGGEVERRRGGEVKRRRGVEKEKERRLSASINNFEFSIYFKIRRTRAKFFVRITRGPGKFIKRYLKLFRTRDFLSTSCGSCTRISKFDAEIWKPREKFSDMLSELRLPTKFSTLTSSWRCSWQILTGNLTDAMEGEKDASGAGREDGGVKGGGRAEGVGRVEGGWRRVGSGVKVE
jgi:hypothetical protein